MDTLTKAAKGNPDQLKAWLPTFESAIVTALHEWAKKTSEVGDNWGGVDSFFAKTHDAEDDCSNVVLPLLAEHRAHETDGQMVTIAWQKELFAVYVRVDGAARIATSHRRRCIDAQARAR